MKKLISLFFFILAVIITEAQNKNLDYFIQHALTSSPLLKDYESQLLSYDLDNKIFLATLRPQVNGVSNNMYAPVISGWGYDKAITNGQQFTEMISVSKTLLNRKSIASKLESLKIQGESVSNSIKISEQDIKKVIVDQYITVFGEQLQIDFYNKVNIMLQKEDSLLKILTQDNVYKQSDYLAFVVTRQQQLLYTSQQETQYYYDYAALNYLAGIIDTSIVSLEDPQLYSAVLSDFTGSLFYKQYQLDSLKLENDKMLVELNYRPRINLFADAGYNSSLDYKPYKNFGTSAGINISIPIYDGKQKKLQYSKINIEENNRLFKKEYFNNQRKQQILQLTQQVKSTERQINQINNQIKYAETLITVNEKLLASGDIRLTDFILSLNNYFTAKNMLTQNYINRLRIINLLNYWEK